MSAPVRAETRRMVDQLTAIRYQRGLTQTDVAEQLGVPRSNVAKFETHKHEPRLSTLLRYAHAVGADITFEVR